VYLEHQEQEQEQNEGRRMKQMHLGAAALLMISALAWAVPAQSASTSSQVAAPQVQPVPGFTHQANVLLQGQAQPQLHIFVEGGSQRVHALSDADGAFNLSVPLKRNQRNNLSVYASTDLNGDEHNSARVRLSIVEDDIAPQITATLDPPPNASGWNRDDVKVKFRCSDRGSGVDACPSEVVVSSQGALQPVSGEVKDKAGNSASVSVTVSIDLGAPIVSLDKPADGTLLYGSPAHLSGALNEALSGIAAVNCNSVPATLSGNSFNCDVPLETGRNAIKVWAVDAAGNVGIARETLVLGPALPGGDAHQVMFSADLNQDQRADVVHTNFLTRDVSILLGNGDGTFQSEQRVTVGPYPSAVAVVDINGDGIPDVITTHYTTAEIAVQHGQPDGSFLPGPRFAVDAFPSALVVADVNGDGRLDIFTAHMHNRQVHLHLAQRDGSFQEQPSFKVGDGPVALAIGDLDGDGKPDLAVANFASGDMSVLLAKGKGDFHREQRLSLNAPAARAAAALNANAAPTAITIADVNGDAVADIITANFGTNSISLLLGAGKGRFQTAQTLAVGAQPTALAVADITGDGKLDLITANAGSADISLLINQGAGNFSSLPLAAGAAPASLIVADLNGDGKLDVVTSGVDGKTQALVSGGDGGLQGVYSVLEAMNAAYVVHLPLVLGDGAFDRVHHSVIHVNNLAQQINEVTITFVDELGGRGVGQYTGTLAAGSSLVVTAVQNIPEGFTGSSPASDFQGAAIISAKRPISAFSELITQLGSRDAYDAIARGGQSNRIVLPNVIKNVIGFNSTIVVQNIGQQDANAHVEYVPVRHGVPGQTAVARLAPGQSRTFRVRDSAIEDETGQFFGAATVVGNAQDQLAVVTVHEALPPQGAGEHVRVYNGIGRQLQSDTLYVPLHMAWHDRMGSGNFFTELDITNAGDQDTEVHISTSRNVALLEQSEKPVCGPEVHFVPDTFAIAAGKTRYVGFVNTRGCKYVGSAVLTSSNAQPLAAVVFQTSNNPSATYPAIPGSATSEEVFLQQVVSQYTSARRYSEIQIQNASSQDTQITVSFGANRLGPSRPPDMARQLSAGQTLYIADLATNGVEYLGSATVRSDNHAKLAVVVTELPRNPTLADDPVQAYIGHAPTKTAVSLNAVHVPDSLIIPFVGPCLAFVEKVRRVRDGFDPSGLFINPSELRPVVPVLGAQDCFETDDDEVNQRAFTQGIQLTRDLPAFLRLDPKPVLGPLPFILLDTKAGWGNFLSNESEATLGTTFSTARSRRTVSSSWLPWAAMAAASAAAALTQHGAGERIVSQVRDIDWYSGPTDLSPSAPDPSDKSRALKRALDGVGSVSAADNSGMDEAELAQLFRDITAFLGIGEATTANPPPPSNPDACRDGILDQVALGVAGDFVRLHLVFSGIPQLGNGMLSIENMTPKQNGLIDTCKILRNLASCMRGTRSLDELVIVGAPASIPQEVRDFFNRYWGHTHQFTGGGKTETWLINLRDEQQPGAGCLF
jgi:hypothetical protein